MHQCVVPCNRIQPAFEAPVASILKVRLIDRKLRKGIYHQLFRILFEVVRGGDCRRNIGADFTLAGGDVLTVIADGRQRAELKSLLGVVSE